MNTNFDVRKETQKGTHVYIGWAYKRGAAYIFVSKWMGLYPGGGRL